jgi:hypothetical protein
MAADDVEQVAQTGHTVVVQGGHVLPGTAQVGHGVVVVVGGDAFVVVLAVGEVVQGAGVGQLPAGGGVTAGRNAQSGAALAVIVSISLRLGAAPLMPNS